jgi:hypothetical protein
MNLAAADLFTATAMSRSQFEPGKVMTAERMGYTLSMR